MTLSEFILNLVILLPLLGYVISLLVPERREMLLSAVASGTVSLHLLSLVSLFGIWLTSNFQTIEYKELVIFKTEHYEFYLDFCFDKVSFIYLLVGAIITFMISIYSRYYLHREKGYKRFFNTFQLFYLGYSLTVISGNLETLFIGWEILGICSFLLIAFYRNRFLPVRNAVKVFTVYRVGDIGLILAMWMAHHLWHQNISFQQLKNDTLVHHALESHSLAGIFISLMILITAAAKSAQLPFTSWLPRAMEGPTPSSAFFYGSLSVHIGAFLLLRTFELWENQIIVRTIIAILGLSTSIIASLIGRVQSNVKSQIAYSSAAQIGIIFIEIALGWENIALVHFAGNAFLRTYQLLVSPSVASYLIREQFYNFQPRELTLEDSLPKRLEHSIYILSLKEWNLDLFMSRYLWNPLKSIGRKLNFLGIKSLLAFFIPLYALGTWALYSKAQIPSYLHEALPVAFALIGLLMVLKSFSEGKQVQLTWLLIIMNHFWVALAVSFNEEFGHIEAYLYLSGIFAAGLVGLVCLRMISKIGQTIDLSRFHGYVFDHPRLAFVFFLACLGLAGFPITPTFIGEDLIFSHVHENQIALAIIISLSFVIDGLSLIRLYGRVFLGPQVKNVQDNAYKSS